MKQFLSFIQKEFFHVFRDSKTLLLLFGLPITLILLFGFALTNEISNAKLMIVDEAGNEYSNQLFAKITASEYFTLVDYGKNENSIEPFFREGKATVALIVGSKNSSLSPTYHIVADGSDPNTASTLTNYLKQIIMDHQVSKIGQEIPMQIKTERLMLYNPELKGATNFVPGVMALVLLLVCVLMTSVSIVREKENGTMEVLLVSPFNPLFVIISKAIPYLLISLVNLAIILLLSVFMLDMPIKGSLFLLVAESTLLIITALSLGLLISTITSSQREAMLISLLGMLLPTVILTGFMFPLENMPLFLQVVSNIVPSKWYYTIVKAIMIKGLGFMEIWKETLILASMSLFLLFISLKKFSIRLS